MVPLIAATSFPGQLVAFLAWVGTGAAAEKMLFADSASGESVPGTSRLAEDSSGVGYPASVLKLVSFTKIE